MVSSHRKPYLMSVFHGIAWFVVVAALSTRSAASTSCLEDYCHEDENSLEYVSLLQKGVIKLPAVAKASFQLNRDTCTEAVLVEPRQSPAIVRVAESALQQGEVDLVTVAHGRLNAGYVQTLVAGSQVLLDAQEQQRLRFLDLRVEDLGGDAFYTMQGTTHKASITPSREQDRPQAAASSSSTRSDVNDRIWGNLTSRLRFFQVNQTYHDQYSRILKSKDFWSRLACDRVVVMQSDTLFCPGSKFRLSDFVGYDYIGGHTPAMDRAGRIHMNGGFSLHSRPAALDCLGIPDPILQVIPGEDSFYSKCPLLRQPPVNVIDHFAVDNALKFVDEIPLGVHKPWAGEYSEHTMDLCKGSRELSAEQPS